jgi:hypothetical protein
MAPEARRHRSKHTQYGIGKDVTSEEKAAVWWLIDDAIMESISS